MRYVSWSDPPREKNHWPPGDQTAKSRPSDATITTWISDDSKANAGIGCSMFACDRPFVDWRCP